MPNPMSFKSWRDYDTAAASASKATISYFFLTFIYMVYFSGVSPGWIGGALFLLIGIFAVSLIIAFPLFYVRTKFKKIGLVIIIVEIVLTIFLTRSVYLWAFSKNIPNKSAFIVNCEVPIPEFTLGYDSDPNKSEIEALCSCIWEKMSAKEKEISKKIQNNHQNEITKDMIQKFTYNFGNIVENCGGKDL